MLNCRLFRTILAVNILSFCIIVNYHAQAAQQLTFQELDKFKEVDFSSLLSQAQKQGSVRLIVGLNVSYQPEAYYRNAQAAVAQQDRITAITR